MGGEVDQAVSGEEGMTMRKTMEAAILKQLLDGLKVYTGFANGHSIDLVQALLEEGAITRFREQGNAYYEVVPGKEERLRIRLAGRLT